MGDRKPSTFAGHSMLCPYEEKPRPNGAGLPSIAKYVREASASGGLCPYKTKGKSAQTGVSVPLRTKR